MEKVSFYRKKHILFTIKRKWKIDYENYTDKEIDNRDEVKKWISPLVIVLGNRRTFKIWIPELLKILSNKTILSY